ncbi:MAG: HAMP domain-containing histidine kinase, partial [Campylobacterales bacterium]|nr:HAMP domain-containing histidine kinase [Campylobacterales bacterium]
SNPNNLELNLKEYNLQDIVDSAKDLILEDLGEIEISIKPLNIVADFNLFSIAIKNLIENALRYSTNSKVQIKNEDKKLIIENSGKALIYPLEKYAEAFALKSIKSKESRGLGFGLYISYHVFKKHGYKFSYSHENSINKFCIEF